MKNLLSAGLKLTVNEVVEDKKRGLVAYLHKADSEISDEVVIKALGDFIRPWEWSA